MSEFEFTDADGLTSLYKNLAAHFNSALIELQSLARRIARECPSINADVAKHLAMRLRPDLIERMRLCEWVAYWLEGYQGAPCDIWDGGTPLDELRLDHSRKSFPSGWAAAEREFPHLFSGGGACAR